MPAFERIVNRNFPAPVNADVGPPVPLADAVQYGPTAVAAHPVMDLLASRAGERGQTRMSFPKVDPKCIPRPTLCLVLGGARDPKHYRNPDQEGPEIRETAVNCTDPFHQHLTWVLGKRASRDLFGTLRGCGQLMNPLSDGLIGVARKDDHIEVASLDAALELFGMESHPGPLFA